MKTLTYRMDHDLGFAPNPFFGWCSLSCCKPRIRKKANEHDLIVGLAGKSQSGMGRYYPRIVYWMQVDQTMSFNDYWNDKRFQLKKPILSAWKMRAVGDNTYRHNSETDEWFFENSMHYIPDAPRENGKHFIKDTSVDRILLSQRFTYWGAKGPKLPEMLLPLFPVSQGEKWNHTKPERLPLLHDLIGLSKPQGLVSDPADWDKKRYFKESCIS